MPPLKRMNEVVEITTRLPLLECAPEEALYDANPAQRRRAARLLAKTTGGSAALVRALEAETDAAVRETLIGCLLRVGDDVAVEGLAAALRSEDASLRNAAVEALGQLGAQRADVLARLAQDADADVRVLAVNAMAQGGVAFEGAVADTLVALLERDPDVNVCAAVLDALCEMGTPGVMSAIDAVQARFSEVPYLQFAAEIARTRVAAVADVP